MDCKNLNTFTYDNKDLSLFNSTICFFEDYTGNQSTGLEREIRSSEYNVRRHERNLFGAVYTTPLEFKIGIMKNDYTDYTAEESRSINNWLTHSHVYTDLHFNNNYKNLEFRAICKNIEDVFYSGISGKEITFECNSPFGYELEKTYTVNGTENGKEVSIINTSDDGDYYPVIEITVDRAVLPKVTIENETDSNSFTIDFNKLIGHNISKPQIAVSTFFYNDEFITPEVVYDTYSTRIVTEESVTTAKNLGHYNITFRLNNNNYTWDDGSKSDVVLDWSIDPYAIHYNLDGGAVAETLKTEYTINDEFTLPQPTKYAQRFIGWTGGKNGELSEPTLDVVIPLGSTGNRTYYANYEADVENTFRFANNGPFILKTKDRNKHWDGTIEYSIDDCKTWSVWDGTDILEGDADTPIYMRGSNNTVITGNSDSNGWDFTGKYCMGNIEVLLDYQTVQNNNHPTMNSYCFAKMFKDCTSLITVSELSATTLTVGCYSGMFYGCTSLTNAPRLVATTLADYCYDSMFYGCTSLTTAPELPATTLADNCYNYMFAGCTSLATTPELSATTLMERCYNFMFSGCTSLTTTPELPATILANECYSGMFGGCTSLVSASELSATALANKCYLGMFNACTSLVEVPELPATTLANNCYASMFLGCTSLTTPPELPATTLTESCYNSMFKGCTSIKLSQTQHDYYNVAYRIPSVGTGFVGTNALDDMFLDTGGEFVGTPSINTTYYSYYEPEDLKYSLKFSSDDDFVLSCHVPNWNGEIEYSSDYGHTWSVLPSVLDTSISGTASQPIFLRGTGNTRITGSSDLFMWTFTGKNITGNIETLLDWRTVANNEHPTMEKHCYFAMFYYCTSLITPPELPAITLTESCYERMFEFCASLTTLPKLPATELSNYCYNAMFGGCSNIKLSTNKIGEYQYAYRIPTSGTGIIDKNKTALISMFSSTGGTFTGTPDINTTYYTTNQPI